MTLVYQDIEEDVYEALKEMVETEVGVDFSIVLVPSKPLSQKGLERNFTGWELLLEALKDRYLVRRDEYKKFRVGTGLVSGTLNKQLRSAHRQITNRLWALAQEFEK